MLEVSGYAWDATCVLTLAACEQPGEFTSVLDRPSLVEGQVLHGEVIYLRPWRDEDAPAGKIYVDADKLAMDAHLEVTEMTEEEQELYVQFAAEVDDGEARTAAVAYKRGLAMATDDRDALRLSRSLSPPIPTIQTPDWLQVWAISHGRTGISLEDAIERVEVKAHYVPPKSHPLRGWWINRGR